MPRAYITLAVDCVGSGDPESIPTIHNLYVVRSERGRNARGIMTKTDKLVEWAADEVKEGLIKDQLFSVRDLAEIIRDDLNAAIEEGGE